MQKSRENEASLAYDTVDSTIHNCMPGKKAAVQKQSWWAFPYIMEARKAAKTQEYIFQIGTPNPHGINQRTLFIQLISSVIFPSYHAPTNCTSFSSG